MANNQEAGEKKPAYTEVRRREEEPRNVPLPLGVDDLLASGDPVLYLSNYKMRYLPRQVLSLMHLEKLYLCDNRFTWLPDGFMKLRGLTTLSLSMNKLDDIPTAVCHLVNLQHLYVSNNRLMTLPQEIGNLKNLRSLWLDANYYQFFPRQLFMLPLLRSLQMGENRMRKLPADLNRMESLRRLWLYNNRLTEFPNVLLKMELEVLDLDSNSITYFPSMLHMTSLHLLSYDHNPVTGPPPVGEEVLVVGEGAMELLETRSKKKEAMEEELKAAEVNAKKAAKAARKEVFRALKIAHKKRIEAGITENGTSVDGGLQRKVEDLGYEMDNEQTKLISAVRV